MIIDIGEKKIEISSNNNLKTAKISFDRFGGIESVETIDEVGDHWIITASGFMIGYMPVGVYDVSGTK